VVGWHKNGKTGDWLRIKVAGSNRGCRDLEVTPNHMVFTPWGEVPAGTLKVGDLVCTEGYRYYSPQQHEVVRGSLLGDGNLRFTRGGTRGVLRFGHSHEQEDYCKYKTSLFGGETTTTKHLVEGHTKSSQEFFEYAYLGGSKTRDTLPSEFIDDLTLRSIAIWYMDDGTYGGNHALWRAGKPSISAKSLDLQSLTMLAEKCHSLGAGFPTVKVGRGLRWTSKEAFKFMLAIAPYIHPSMSYKIKEGIPVGSSLGVLHGIERREVFSEPILSIDTVTKEQDRYDITVEGYQNYLVSGVVVHNSPETTPGGQTVKFNASFIVRIAGKDRMVKEVSSQVPAFKDTSFIIKKAKIGVTQTSFDYSMCVLEHDGLCPGDTESFTMLKTMLQSGGHLAKSVKGPGWTLLGKTYQTLALLADTYYAEPGFALHLQQLAISSSTLKMSLVAPEPEAPYEYSGPMLFNQTGSQNEKT